jgi:hypothetical protein
VGVRVDQRRLDPADLGAVEERAPGQQAQVLNVANQYMSKIGT